MLKKSKDKDPCGCKQKLSEDMKYDLEQLPAISRKTEPSYSMVDQNLTTCIWEKHISSATLPSPLQQAEIVVEVYLDQYGEFLSSYQCGERGLVMERLHL